MTSSLYSRSIALSLLFLLGLSLNDLSAQRQYETWYFGSNAGISFQSGVATPILDGQVNTIDGSAVISRATTGELLFYSDGKTVWDANHTPMPNGTGLAGHESSGQPALIVPLPGDSNRFYLFTTGAANTPTTETRYSTVDMTLNGGRGDVVLKNQVLLNRGTEKITATRACNGIDYWVIAHTWGSNRFTAYLLTAAGITDSVTSDVGISYPSSADVQGTFQMSSNGKLLGVSSPALQTLELFDFDNGTGVISNQRVLGESDVAYYGLEFSPDGQRIYVNTLPRASDAAHLFQYDLAAGDLNAIRASRFQYVELRERNWQGGQLQLGVDGKIYVSWDNRDSLGVIEDPNALGGAAGYQHSGFWLGGRRTRYGLPNVIDSDLDTTQRSTNGVTTSISFRPTSAKPGETVTVVIVVCNQGNQPLLDIDLEVNVDAALTPTTSNGSGLYTLGRVNATSCDSFSLSFRVPGNAAEGTRYQACLEFLGSTPTPCVLPPISCGDLLVEAAPVDVSEVDFTYYLPTSCPGTTDLVEVIFHSRRFTDTVIGVSFQGPQASLFSYGGTQPINFAIKPTSDQLLPIVVRRSESGRQTAVMVLTTSYGDTFRLRLISDVKVSTMPFLNVNEIRTGGRSSSFDTCLTVTNITSDAVVVVDTAWIHRGRGASLLSPAIPFSLGPGDSREICFRVTNPGSPDIDTLILGGSEPTDVCPHCFHHMIVINGLPPAPVSSVRPSTGSSIHDLRVSPNPAAERVTARITLNAAGSIDAELLDLTGHPRLQYSIEHAAKGQHVVPFNCSTLPSGTYLMRVIVDGIESIAPVQIIR